MILELFVRGTVEAAGPGAAQRAGEPNQGLRVLDQVMLLHLGTQILFPGENINSFSGVMLLYIVQDI